MKTSEILYKYRSLNSFDYFVDILINRRLYAASYKELNDLQEGKYLCSPGTLNTKERNELLMEKEKIRICSLSTQRNDPAMWAYYADSNKGVNLGVIVTSYKCEILAVNYSEHLEIMEYKKNGTAKEILSHKDIIWSHENEKRVLTFGHKDNYITIQVKEIILGARISKLHSKLIKQLAEKFAPDAEIINYNDL